MEISDNGRGFAGDASASNHFGVAGMHERALSIHGSLSVKPSQNGGTNVAIVVPIP
jgi:signal transduction histidine kinase